MEPSPADAGARRGHGAGGLPAAVEAPAAGWHKLGVSYFQRRGTWALQLYWMPPGGKDPVLIPAEAYAHTN